MAQNNKNFKWEIKKPKLIIKKNKKNKKTMQTRHGPNCFLGEKDFGTNSLATLRMTCHVMGGISF